jgi:NADPH-ferrihemoprotein reductase
MGKYFDKRVEQLNGSRLMELGMGDDDANIEEDFVTWMDKFWTCVCDQFGISSQEQDGISIRQYKQNVHKDLPSEKVFKGEVSRLNSYIRQRPPFDAKNPFMAPITVNKCLFKNTDRKCLHIELDITGSRLRYEAGDHVAIYPSNDASLVAKFADLFQIDLDTIITLENLDEDATKKNPFPCPCSYRTALTHYLDIASLPTTQSLKELAQYTSNDEEKKQLLLMGSPTDEGKKSYNAFIRDNLVDIVTLLEKMPSIKPPIDHVLELMPRLQVRYYSISSSPKVYPNSIHVTCTVIEYKTKDGRTRKGTCTTWLSTKLVLEENQPGVPIFVRKSQFRLPFKFQTPVVMIGPGTGLAPFRGFIQERDFYKKEGRQVGSTILYYGCRKQTEDYLYPDELEAFEKNGTLTKLNLAFSRDQEEKNYVTHLLKRDSNMIWNLIQEGGHVYVCGDAKSMARDVNEILIGLCKTEGNMSTDEATQYIKDLSQKTRYVLDVWS